MIDGYDEIAAVKFEISTSCIVCGKTIALEPYQAPNAPRVCDECKEAVAWAKEKMKDGNPA